MNLGLAFLAQVQDSYARLTFDSLLANIGAGYHTQHNTDDTHGTITATGSISEYGRTTPLGDWIEVPFNAGNYTALGTMTWTVTAAQQLRLAYYLVGKTMVLNFYINSSTLGGAANTHLYLKIPDNYLAALGNAVGTTMVNNGTDYAGRAISGAGSERAYIILRTANGGNWDTASSASVSGQIAFDIV